MINVKLTSSCFIVTSLPLTSLLWCNFQHLIADHRLRIVDCPETSFQRQTVQSVISYVQNFENWPSLGRPLSPCRRGNPPCRRGNPSHIHPGAFVTPFSLENSEGGSLSYELNLFNLLDGRLRPLLLAMLIYIDYTRVSTCQPTKF